MDQLIIVDLYFENSDDSVRDRDYHIISPLNSRLSNEADTATEAVRTLSVSDKRGIAGGHNKMTKHQRSCVINHINKFPRYKFHYCKAHRNEQKFLPVGTTLSLMYKLYNEENLKNDCVRFSSYRKIFLTEFNHKTKAPQKDTCNKYDTFQAKS
ncbi:hypothetical protein RN001_004729 [Aquatica leii]|uniref:Uncharacterized protein n=1 Tax=Aquatica leii TaxID=1421715 RepID=A0AAN7P5Q6_9COLE|nr:hypothetical protein RN001_004729 [Aquatica leii]